MKGFFCPAKVDKYILCKTYPSRKGKWNSCLILLYFCWSFLAIKHTMSKENVILFINSR